MVEWREIFVILNFATVCRTVSEVPVHHCNNINATKKRASRQVVVAGTNDKTIRILVNE